MDSNGVPIYFTAKFIVDNVAYGFFDAFGEDT